MHSENLCKVLEKREIKWFFFIWSNLRYKWFFLHCLCSIIISEGQKEDVFLLGGSDKKVHLYKEVRLKILKSLGDISLIPLYKVFYVLNLLKYMQNLHSIGY